MLLRTYLLQASAVLLSFGLLGLGLLEDWWLIADMLLVLAIAMTAAAVLVGNDHEMRVIALLFSIVFFEAWQGARWHYNGWQLAAVVLFAGIIPPMTLVNIAVWPEIWRERKARRFPETTSLNLV
ncbi:MAG TPA: hypothetical protein VFT49_02315 [Candidatus Saccharimonadales bacterium]|nr:hypothetical protein [Candidatus Saccharimonadales bacterium]